MKLNLSQNKFTLSFLIILLIIFLHYITILSPLEKLITIILSPFQSATYNITTNISDRLEQITIKENLNLENQELKEKINKLEQQIVNLKMFIEENEMIIEQTEYLQSQNYSFVNAKIISRAVETNPNLFIINQGKNSGIKKGMAVITGQGIVIGKIIDIQARQSSLLLLINNSCEMSASLAGHSEIVGLVQGQHNISIGLTNVLKNSQIEKQDIIITSGQDEYIPSGLLIGQVDEIIDNEGELFKKANLTTQVNFKNLRVVSVIRK